MQAGVDAGRRARARDHRLLIHVQDARVDLRAGIAPGQFSVCRQCVVHRRPLQQARLAEHEDAAADAQHPGSAIGRTAQGGQQRPGELAALRRAAREAGGYRARRIGPRRGQAGDQASLPQPPVGHGGHGDQVRLLQAVQAVRRLDGEALVAADRARLAGHHREVVGGQPVVGPVDAEHLAHHAELERLERGPAPRPPRSSACLKYDRSVGRMSSLYVTPATVAEQAAA